MIPQTCAADVLTCLGCQIAGHTGKPEGRHNHSPARECWVGIVNRTSPVGRHSSLLGRRRSHRFAAIGGAHVIAADGAAAVTTARGQGMAALRAIAEVRSDLGTTVGARYQ